MTEIVIFPASHDDALGDYKRFVQHGHLMDDLKSYFAEDEVELLRTTSENGRVDVWGHQ
jgi:hypothetical protein